MIKTAALFLLVFSVLLTGNAQSGSFAISIAIANNRISSGTTEEDLQINLTNISSHDLSIYSPFAETGIAQMFDIDVRDSTGASAQETSLGMYVHGKTSKQKMTSGPTQLISSGKTLARSTNLAAIFDLTKPGTYMVQVTRSDRDRKVLVKSNVITITVTP